MGIRPQQRCKNQIESAAGSAGGLGCFLLAAVAPGPQDLNEHSNGVRLSLGDNDQRGPRWPGCTSPSSLTPASPPYPLPSIPAFLSGKSHGDAADPPPEQNMDKGRSPETCSLHRELLQGNKAADVRNATGLFAQAALCLRQRGHASACRFKSYCCSGLGASLFPLPFSPGLVTARY